MPAVPGAVYPILCRVTIVPVNVPDNRPAVLGKVPAIVPGTLPTVPGNVPTVLGHGQAISVTSMPAVLGLLTPYPVGFHQYLVLCRQFLHSLWHTNSS